MRRAEKELETLTQKYVDADRRAAQAQGSRAPRGLRAGSPRTTTSMTDRPGAGRRHPRSSRSRCSRCRRRSDAAGPAATCPAAIGVGARSRRRRPASRSTSWKPAFVGVVAVAVVLGLWELANALRAPTGSRVPLVPLVGRRASRCSSSAYAGGREALLVALALTVLARRASGGCRRTPQGYVRGRRRPGVFVALYVPFLAGFAALMLRAGRRRRPGRRASSCSWCSATSAATPPACCSASTRWRRRSARRSPGRASPARRSFCAVGGAIAVPTAAATAAGGRASLLGLAVDGHRHARRPRRVDDQARPRHQGHGHAAARPRRHDGPARLAAAGGPGRLLLLHAGCVPA